jgi:hypothetical protein
MKQYPTHLSEVTSTSSFASSSLRNQFTKRIYAIIGAAMLIFSKPAGAQSVGGPTARTEWHMGYNAAIPVGEMSKYANTLHSLLQAAITAFRPAWVRLT